VKPLQCSICIDAAAMARDKASERAFGIIMLQGALLSIMDFMIFYLSFHHIFWFC
jgi:hypothetical protein